MACWEPWLAAGLLLGVLQSTQLEHSMQSITTGCEVQNQWRREDWALWALPWLCQAAKMLLFPKIWSNLLISAVHS